MQQHATVLNSYIDAWSFEGSTFWEPDTWGYKVTRFHVWLQYSKILYFSAINVTASGITELSGWRLVLWGFGLTGTQDLGYEVTQFHIWTQYSEICYLHAINATTRYSLNSYVDTWSFEGSTFGGTSIWAPRLRGFTFELNIAKYAIYML